MEEFKDNLQQNKFTVSFPRISDVAYDCQSVNIPGLILGSALQATSFTDMPVAGDKIEHDTLTIRFIIDEDMTNWLQIYNWVKSLGFDQSFDQYNNQKDKDGNPLGDAADCIVNINTNKGVLNLIVKFTNCIPVTLTGIEFDNTVTEISPLIGEATFKYAYYEIERI